MSNMLLSYNIYSSIAAIYQNKDSFKALAGSLHARMDDKNGEEKNKDIYCYSNKANSTFHFLMLVIQYVHLSAVTFPPED